MVQAFAIRSEPIFYVKRVQRRGGTREIIDISQKVLSLNYEDSEKKADRLSLTMDNWDLELFDDPFWKKGAHLEISFGYGGALSPPREVVVQRISGFQTLKIEGISKAILMHKLTRNEVFENKKRSEVAEIIAERNGYGDTRRFIEDTEEILPAISQARLTDAQFMKRLADREGFEFYIDFDGFHFEQRKMDQEPFYKSFIWYNDPDRGEIISISVDSDVSTKPGRVRVKGRDPIRKVDINEVGSDSTTSRNVIAPVPEIVDPDLAKATKAESVASEEVRPTPQTLAKTAKREANAKYRGTQQKTHELTMTIVGDPRILAKSIIQIDGISKRMSGLWYVNEVVNTIDGNGYTTRLKCSRDGSSEIPGEAKLKTAKAQRAAKIARAKQRCKQYSSNIGGVLDSVLQAVRTELTEISGDDSAQAAFLKFSDVVKTAKANIQGVPGDVSYYKQIESTAKELSVAAEKASASDTSKKAKIAAEAAKLGATACAAADTAAKLNKKKASEAKSKTLKQKASIDPDTGKPRIRYWDRKGRG